MYKRQDYALNTINQMAKTGKPFMATILTVSNHPPYIIPDFFKPKTKEKETQIVEYADWAIFSYLLQRKCIVRKVILKFVRKICNIRLYQPR